MGGGDGDGIPHTTTNDDDDDEDDDKAEENAVRTQVEEK
jgi:hypothetical protein